MYHYTSTLALMAIVESHLFRATDAFFMNDAEEITYGFRRMIELSKLAPNDKKNSSRSRAVRRRIGAALSKLLTIATGKLADGEDIPRCFEHLAPLKIFVACFSELRDDLNQWRGYTQRGHGVCIGFDHKSLIKIITHQGWDWSHCVYEEDEQNRWGNAPLTLTSRKVESLLDHDENWDISAAVEHVVSEEAEKIFRVASRIKHPAFKDEKEWRLISPLIPANDPRVKFQERGGIPVPFVELPLSTEVEGKCHIEDVTVGPTMHPELAERSITSFLQASEVSFGQVLRSTIPFRTLGS